MGSIVGAAGGWYHAVLLGALPWLAALAPRWAPTIAALLVVGYLIGLRPPRSEPWPWLAAGGASLIALVGHAGWRVALGWVALAVIVAGSAALLAGRCRVATAVSWTIAAVGWAAAMAAAPRLMATVNGGWIAPAVLVIAAQRAASSFAAARKAPEPPLAPPSREVRGTLSLRSVVAAGPDGMPRTIPLDLELRAGQSLAVLCATNDDAWVLARVLSGRSAPVAGELAVDGGSVSGTDRLVAVVAPGEPFLEGDIELNLAALCDEFPDRETVVATVDACALDEIAEALGDRPLEADGAPLSTQQRLQLAAARVIPSSYRLVVVVDPMPWANPVHGEIWRSAVVRASLGRTAIWLTSDRQLAARADRVLAFRSGGLRQIDLDS